MKSTYILAISAFAALLAVPAFAQSNMQGQGMQGQGMQNMHGQNMQNMQGMHSQSMQGMHGDGMGMQGSGMGHMMGMHMMPATVTGVNVKTGIVDVTSEGMKLRLHFPPASLASLKSGDKITLHMGFMRQ